MELFHIHTLGNYDEMYEPNNIINIDNNFNNGIYQKIYNLNMTFDQKSLPNLFESINKELRGMGFEKRVDKSRIDELMQYIEFFGCDEKSLKAFLKVASTVIKEYYNGMNELAYERSRELYSPYRPSRLHSLFACTEEGLYYWLSILKDKRMDVYRIDTVDQPFVTNPSLLPSDDMELYNKVLAARSYFNPEYLQESTSNEYLVTGTVLLRDKVREIRR